MFVCIHDIIQLTLMNIMMKMKNRSHRHITDLDLNLDTDNSKYRECLSMIMFLWTKEHLSNIWSSIHKKVKQHWGWVEKSVFKKT